MKLVFYTPRFYPMIGGLEKVARVWADALTKLGHEIIVITNTVSDKPDEFDFNIFRNISFTKQLRLMRSSDLLIQFNVSLKGLFAVKLSGRPLVISHHTALFYPNGRKTWQQRLKHWVSEHWVNKNICCSNYIAQQFNHASVVYSPFERGVFTNKQIERKKNSVVFVGRLVSDKGVDILVQAFSLLVSKFPSSSLTIIGDGPDKKILAQMVRKEGLFDKVIFTGSISPVLIADLLNENEIMVVPSRMEPFGTTVLEGLACGCRMVVSDQGGLPEAGNAWVRYFKNENADNLFEVLMEELGQPSLFEKYEIDNYLEKFSVETTARQFGKLLEQTLMPLQKLKHV